MHPELCLGMLGLSGWEILIVLVVALLIFGKRLPGLMRGLGGSVREFRAGASDDPPAAPPAPPAAPSSPA